MHGEADTTVPSVSTVDRQACVVWPLDTTHAHMCTHTSIAILTPGSSVSLGESPFCAHALPGKDPTAGWVTRAHTHPDPQSECWFLHRRR